MTPDLQSKWYLSDKVGGLSRCISMNAQGSVLPNCVGYALGRFHEVLSEHISLDTFAYKALDTAPCKIVERCAKYYPELIISDTPREHSIIVILYHGDRFGGHVAYVEAINNDFLLISESSYKQATYQQFWISLAALQAKGQLKFIYTPIAE